MRDSRRAVTLVEILVVVGIIGVLISLALPAAQQARGAAARMSCQNNMRQIGLALHHYHDRHGGLPPRPPRTPTGDPNSTFGWMVLILPDLEQNELYRVSEGACRLDPDPLHNPPHTGMATVVRTYACPVDGRLMSPLTDSFGVRSSYTSYIGIRGVLPPGASTGFEGAFGDAPGYRFAEITDGLSQTVLVGERPPPDTLQAGWWYPAAIGSGENFRGPNNTVTLGGVLLFAGDPCKRIKRVFGPGRLENPCDRFHLWSLHPGGANFLFADGSVRFLPYSAEPAVIALASRNGGEAVEIP